MSYLNVKERTLEIKVVYYGAGLSGKTTNLEKVKENSAGDRAGEMMSLNTDGDRTLFFDYLPYELGKFNGCDVKVQLYTVPGQAKYAETRRRVLAGADGVVLVLDSAAAALDRNHETVADLRKHLAANGLRADTPIVVQANKRDLPDAMEVAALLSALGLKHLPCIEGVAVNGVGVFETLKRIVAEVLGHVREAARSGPERASIGRGDNSGLDGDTLRDELVPGANGRVADSTKRGATASPRAETTAKQEPASPRGSAAPVRPAVSNDLAVPKAPPASAKSTAANTDDDAEPPKAATPTRANKDESKRAPSSRPAPRKAPAVPLRPSTISVAHDADRAASVAGASAAGKVTPLPTRTSPAGAGSRETRLPAFAVAPAPKPVAISTAVTAGTPSTTVLPAPQGTGPTPRVTMATAEPNSSAARKAEPEILPEQRAPLEAARDVHEIDESEVPPAFRPFLEFLKRPESQLEELGDRVGASLEAKLKTLRSELETARESTTADLKAHEVSVSTQVEDVSKQLESLETRLLGSLKAFKGKLQEAAEAAGGQMEAHRSNVSAQIEEVAKHFVNLERKVQNSLHQMNERLDEVATTSSSQLEDHRRAISNQVSRVSEQIDALEGKVDRNLKSFRSDVEERIGSLTGLENRLLTHLRGFKDEVDDRVTSLNGLEGRLQSNLNSAKGDIETRLSDVMDLQGRLQTAIRGFKENVDGRFDEVDARVEAKLSPLTEELRGQRTDLAQRLEPIGHALANLEMSLSETSTELRSGRVTKADLEQAVTSLYRRVTEIRTQITSDAERVVDEVGKQESAIGTANTQLEGVVARQQRLEQLSADAAAEIAMTHESSERAVKAAEHLRKLLEAKLTALDARIEKVERQNGIIRKEAKEGFASIPETVVKPIAGMGDKIQGAVDKLTTNSGKAHHSMSAALKKIDSSLGALRSTTDETRANMQAVGSRIDGAASSVVENAAAIRSEVVETQHIVKDSANEVLDTMRGGLEDHKASNDNWRAEIATMVRDGFSEVRERLDLKKSRWLG